MNWLVEKACAQNWVNLLSPPPTGATGSISTLLDKIIVIIITIASALAVIYLIYSGIIYITAAGNPDNAKKGQQGVINAVIGIVIIVATYFIIQVAIDLGKSFTNSNTTQTNPPTNQTPDH